MVDRLLLNVKKSCVVSSASLFLKNKICDPVLQPPLFYPFQHYCLQLVYWSDWYSSFISLEPGNWMQNILA